jgi:hypothetical protein
MANRRQGRSTSSLSNSQLVHEIDKCSGCPGKLFVSQPRQYYIALDRFTEGDTHDIEVFRVVEDFTRKMFDLPYASLSPAQQLDIYWPSEDNGRFPVIMRKSNDK